MNPETSVMPLPSRADCAAAARALVTAQGHSVHDLTAARWLAGSTSHLHLAFDLDWTPVDAARRRTPMVLRLETPGLLPAAQRARECQVLAAVRECLPVPALYACDEAGAVLPRPGLICALVPGAVPGDDVGAGFIDELAAGLARVHALPLQGDTGSALAALPPGTVAASQLLERWEQLRAAADCEAVPLLELAGAWLRAEIPHCRQPVLLHGDLHAGNCLVDPRDGHLSALLDWEMSFVGDHHFDLAGLSLPGWSEAKGRTAGLDPARFCAAYAAAGGLPLDPVALRYYEVLVVWARCILLHAVSWRCALQSDSHAQARLAWITGRSYPLMAQLSALLARA
jgi:aminoglycoside phosphotransferase (APT) family kinase protein